MITDPRAFSEEKLTPPRPLPHVSRKVLAKVKYPQPIPKTCHLCGGDVILVDNSVVYRYSFGNWHYVYMCRSCRAYVGLHGHTDIPLGTLANATTRRRRKEVHEVARHLRDYTGLTLEQCRELVASKLSISYAEAATACLDHHQCDTVINMFKDTLKSMKARAKQLDEDQNP